jgi:hypothetical protein
LRASPFGFEHAATANRQTQTSGGGA